MWQDIGIMLISIMFTAFIIPQIRSGLKGDHANPWMSGCTALGCYGLSFIYSTLGFWFSTVTAVATAIAWTVVWLLWDHDHFGMVEKWLFVQ